MGLDLTAILRGEPESDGSMPDNVIIDIFDGRVIENDDADSLIDAYEQAKEAAEIIAQWQRKLRESLASLSEGDTKTRRVRGKRRVAKVVTPDNSWDQSILREAWNSYPHLRDEMLKIGTLNVKAREYKKAVNTSGPDDFNQFVGMLKDAERPATGLPTVTIEK